MLTRYDFTFALIVAASLMLAGCGGDSAAAHKGAPTEPPVVIYSAPLEQQVTDYRSFTGRTDAVKSVDIRARVTGFLQKIGFEEGKEVKSVPPGDEADATPLFEIDPREYQADLDAAVASVASAEAQLEKATTDFERVKQLREKGAASAEEFDRTATAKKEAAAALQSARAKQDRAQLNVDFTKIYAPIAGQISRAQITEGNLVTADSTLLTTIVSVDPMYAYFDVDERTLLDLQKMVREGKLKAKGDDEEIPVELGVQNEEGYPHKGTINFAENRFDPNTGTIRIRGVFENPLPKVGKRVLAPGMFVRIRVPIGDPHPALLISERAIGRDQGQTFVFVLDDKDEVVYRRVKLGPQQEDLRVIEEGLKPGERVIINGLQRVRPGVKVSPKPGDMQGKAEPDPKAQNAKREIRNESKARMT
jgi:RND family efflux transporter MFP subunit